MWSFGQQQVDPDGQDLCGVRGEMVKREIEDAVAQVVRNCLKGVRRFEMHPLLPCGQCNRRVRPQFRLVYDAVGRVLQGETVFQMPGDGIAGFRGGAARHAPVLRAVVIPTTQTHISHHTTLQCSFRNVNG